MGIGKPRASRIDRYRGVQRQRSCRLGEIIYQLKSQGGCDITTPEENWQSDEEVWEVVTAGQRCFTIPSSYQLCA